jgi:hypothetical protein
VIGSAFLWATARSAPSLRRLGLVSDAVRLWSRATRQRRAWSAHEERCHAAVREVVASLPSRRSVLVLGSGLCRDVPVDHLLATFDDVVLVDAVHLLPVRLRYGRRVRLAVADLTGMADWLDGEAEGRTEPLAPWHDDPRVDLVISANVLSQLPHAVARRIDRDPVAADRVGPDPGRRIVAGHLDDLARFRCRTCLLSDTRYREVDVAGRALAEWDLLEGVTLPPADRAWDWTVAPRGELDRTLAFVHRAGAWLDLGRSAKADAGAFGAMPPAGSA